MTPPRSPRGRLSFANLPVSEAETPAQVPEVAPPPSSAPVVVSRRPSGRLSLSGLSTSVPKPEPEPEPEPALAPVAVRGRPMGGVSRGRRHCDLIAPTVPSSSDPRYGVIPF